MFTCVSLWVPVTLATSHWTKTCSLVNWYLQIARSCECVCFMSALWWNGHLTRVYPASRPMLVGIGSSPLQSCIWHRRQQRPLNKSFTDWHLIDSLANPSKRRKHCFADVKKKKKQCMRVCVFMCVFVPTCSWMRKHNDGTMSPSLHYSL